MPPKALPHPRNIGTWHELPPQPELEVPLLRAIARRGGRVDISIRKGDLLDELARMFDITPQQQEFDTDNSTPENLWYNWIRQVRRALVAKKELDNSIPDVWKITERGLWRLERERSRKR